MKGGMERRSRAAAAKRKRARDVFSLKGLGRRFYSWNVALRYCITTVVPIRGCVCLWHRTCLKQQHMRRGTRLVYSVKSGDTNFIVTVVDNC
eukprot:IDg12036t1